jgi:DNA-binding transcriptional LysR family regulator
MLKEFHGLYPGVRLRLLNLTARGIARALEEGEADIGFGFLVEGNPDITARRLAGAHFVLACARDSLLAQKRRLLLDEILAGPLLHFEEGVELRVHLERGLKGKRSLDPVLELPTIESILQYVRNGFGHSILPEYAISDCWRNELVLRKLNRWIAPLDICAYVHRKRLLSNAAAKLLERLPHAPRRGRELGLEGKL